MTCHSRMTGGVDTLALHCSGASGRQWRRLQEHGAGARPTEWMPGSVAAHDG